MSSLNTRRSLLSLTILITIVSLSFVTILNQTGSSALSITQTSGKVIAAEFEGIDGESDYQETENWIDVISYSWGAHSPAAGSIGASRRRGSIVIEDFVLVKNVDKSTPKLMEKGFRGETIPNVRIVEYINGLKIWEYELRNVMITSFLVAGSREYLSPDLEQVSLSFEEITYIYTQYDESGNSMGDVEFNWKVERGA